MSLARTQFFKTLKPGHMDRFQSIGAAGFEPTIPTTPKSKLKYSYSLPNQGFKQEASLLRLISGLCRKPETYPSFVTLVRGMVGESGRVLHKGTGKLVHTPLLSLSGRKI